MPTVLASAVRPPETRRGFTLIELLVVIAIIAILAAIIFPVFSKVREKARQTTVISNMHQIQTGMGAYQLDYHKYPDVLFGYADAGGAMSTYTPAAGSVPGLFPNYVKDYRVFTDPNNTADPASTTAVTPALAVNLLQSQPDGTATLTPPGPPHKFFTADAYDVGPRVTGTNTVDTATYIPRYQLSWTDISTTAKTAAGADYQRQMRWKSPLGDTYVTCSTYHVAAAGKVIVLFNEGPAKVLDTSLFMTAGGGTADATSVSNANFWKLRP